MLMLLAITFVSCGSDDEPSSEYWFDGKYFSAKATTTDGEQVWMVLHFRHDKSTTLQSYFFTVDPYDLNGKRIDNVQSYSGRCTMNDDGKRIHLGFDTGSASYVWTYRESADQGWPYYNPNITITTSSTQHNPLPNFEFTSGKAWERED